MLREKGKVKVKPEREGKKGVGACQCEKEEMFERKKQPDTRTTTRTGETDRADLAY